MSIPKEDDIAIWNLATEMRKKLAYTAPELAEERMATYLERAYRLGAEKAAPMPGADREYCEEYGHEFRRGDWICKRCGTDGTGLSSSAALQVAIANLCTAANDVAKQMETKLRHGRASAAEVEMAKAAVAWREACAAAPFTRSAKGGSDV